MTNQCCVERLSESIDRSALTEPSFKLQDFAQKFDGADDDVLQRRRSRRHQQIIQLVVLPLDEQRQPAGPPFIAYSRNFSKGGLSLIHTREAPSELLYIEMDWPAPPTTKAILKVLRSRPIGEFFEIGGEFVWDSRNSDESGPCESSKSPTAIDVAP